MPQELAENRSTSLLCKDDNEQVFTLLGVRCQALATTVIQLYGTEPPHHSQWLKKDTGILCFVKDNFRKNYFFRLYCLRRNAMIWEHALYNNIEYVSSCDFFHTFEGEDHMVAFNFANVMEAKEFKIVVDRKIMIKKRKEDRKNSKNSLILQQENQTPRLPSSVDLMMYKKPSDPAERRAKRRRNITKADIGKPSEFRHVSHVGFDPDKGFDINCDDPQLKTFFSKAGVSDKQLQDKDTREYIYNFINKNGGIEAIQDAVEPTRKMAPAPPSPISGPPVPPRGTGKPHNRAAPPPPPSLVQNSWPTQPPKVTPQVNNIPPPPPGIAPPPPPPLPPPMELPASIPSVIPEAPPPAPDMRSALMDSIRSGITLKTTEVENKKTFATNDARDDLLSEIRQGIQLKPTTEREVKPISPLANQNRCDLASALAKALADRDRVMHSEDDSTSDTDSNDDDWYA